MIPGFRYLVGFWGAGTASLDLSIVTKEHRAKQIAYQVSALVLTATATSTFGTSRLAHWSPPCAGPAGEAIGGVAFSPRDEIGATTTNNIKGTKTAICIWNAAHKLVATSTTQGRPAASYRLAFSPDGSAMAVGDTNEHAYIWNMSWLKP
jgi:WD40 repeat protein